MVRSLNGRTIVRLALVGVAAASLAACAKKDKPAFPVTQAPPQTQAPQTQMPPTQGPVSQAPVGALPGSAQDFIVNVGDRVYFDTDSHDVRADAQPILDAQSAWLRQYPAVNVRIEGNADERGTREYNLALGARRANAVRDYLVGRGIESARIATISFGKEQPLDAGSGEDAWARNRNGHTAIVSGAR
ncbi:peptidoglycan-associated lipoprotein Pal [Phenylobacterium sp.]|uniref:peptidoglycan-associated lipoprotein Pal n=1 Tax=Phenylobacterium sp. TaxID=1871053 RepID=UPI0025F1B5C5|nr:peptidoglycan-associated lipoprotein Pal [Phenylobacterium sp.]MBX3484608.1 peptidoglycan-associated lipoprotein Pal [Phenylobacterium sp.]MCW5759642.1 peptidoglycan-associated lipoprotein Pal [Phenylobacterium sp.]